MLNPDPNPNPNPNLNRRTLVVEAEVAKKGEEETELREFNGKPLLLRMGALTVHCLGEVQWESYNPDPIALAL